MTLKELNTAARSMMESLGIKGSLSITYDGQGSHHGWVGKPGGEDVEIVMTVKTLPRMMGTERRARGARNR